MRMFRTVVSTPQCRRNRTCGRKHHGPQSWSDQAEYRASVRLHTPQKNRPRPQEPDRMRMTRTVVSRPQCRRNRTCGRKRQCSQRCSDQARCRSWNRPHTPRKNRPRPRKPDRLRMIRTGGSRPQCRRDRICGRKYHGSQRWSGQARRRWSSPPHTPRKNRPRPPKADRLRMTRTVGSRPHCRRDRTCGRKHHGSQRCSDQAGYRSWNRPHIPRKNRPRPHEPHRVGMFRTVGSTARCQRNRTCGRKHHLSPRGSDQARCRPSDRPRRRCHWHPQLGQSHAPDLRCRTAGSTRCHRAPAPTL